jgi:uroporphyrinogen decarboxylase
MNSRERIIAAIEHKLPDRLPIAIIDIENMDALCPALGMEPAEVLKHLGIDSYIIGPGYTGPKPADFKGQPVSEWGGPGGNDYGQAHVYPFADGITVRDIERHAWPNPADYDYADSARRAKELAAEYAVRGPYWLPIFCQVCDLFGMENAMVKMVSEPELTDAALEQITPRVVEIVARLLDACGDDMPILCLGDDFATQRGMMISPALWRRTVKPQLAKVFEVGKARGKHIWFHSCGDVTAVLPDLIDIGMDVWETVQLHTLPMTPQELKREYGRHITFFGAVNTQRLPFAKPEEVEEETRRCIEILGEGGGYICGPDHHVKPDVSADNTLALFRTAQAFRKKGYTLGE